MGTGGQPTTESMIKIKTGEDKKQHSAGRLTIITNQPSALLYSPAGLKLASDAQNIDVVEDAGMLRQIEFRIYLPSLARFISEDPIGVMGGLNLYRFAKNDAINMLDFYGLWEKWCFANNSARQIYKSDCGDTVKDLADILSLSPQEFNLWLKPSGGSKMPASIDEPLSIAEYTVPNQVVIVIGMEMGLLTKEIVRSMAHGFSREVESAGFDAVIYGTGDSDPGGLHMESEDLIKYAFYGHGSEGVVFPNKSGFAAGRYSNHKLASVYIIACESHAGESQWRLNVSEKGILQTIQGWFPKFFKSRTIHGEN